MGRVPNDLDGLELARWMIDELELESEVERIRTALPDLRLDELRYLADINLRESRADPVPVRETLRECECEDGEERRR